MSTSSGNAGAFAVPTRRRVLLRKRPGQRQTTRRPYGSVILAPPTQSRGNSSTPGAGGSQSPRPAILGRAASPGSISPALGASSPALSAAGPSPSPSPAGTSQPSQPPQPSPPPKRPAEEFPLAVEGQPTKKRPRKLTAPVVKKRQRGSSSEALLALRQVEAIVADRRADEDDPDMHDMCSKFVKDIAAEISEQAGVVDENAHLQRAHTRLASEKREIKQQLLHLQTQRSEIGQQLQRAKQKLETETMALQRTAGLSKFLLQVQRVQAAAIKKAKGDVQWDCVENLKSFVASANQNGQHLAVLQHTNTHLEALHSVLSRLPTKD